VQNIIFWKQSPNASFKDLGFNLKTGNIENIYLRDIEMLEERDYFLIQLQFDIIKQQSLNSNAGWVDVSNGDFKNIINVAKKIAAKHFLNPKMKNQSLKFLGAYQMIITGTEKDYWTKSEIDIHKFKINVAGAERQFKLTDLESESNLSVFNKELFGSKYLRGDMLGNLKLPTTIFGLGNIIADEFHPISRTYLLNLSVNSIHPDDNEALSKQNKLYRLTINTVISNFGNLLVYIAKMTDLYNDEYNNIQSNSNEIRDKALDLQIRINELLKSQSDKSSLISTGTPKKKEKNHKDQKEQNDLLTSRGWEENLLLKASRHFSKLTEINQILAKANYQRQDAAMNIEKMTSTLGLTPIKYYIETEKEISSLGLELKQFSKSVNYYFQNLKDELDHSQTTIRDTVDILKTFLESEQRIVSQKSSEAINWIVIVFAGLGLADALGNFVIFWLEGGSPYQAMFWFFIILITLIIIIVTLYMWYFKRPQYLARNY
jgi:hypothetical protein